MCALRDVKLTNLDWSCCGLKDDGTLAIFTLWQDCFVEVEGEPHYPLTRKVGGGTDENSQHRGWCEVVDVANHCLDHPGIRVLGVMCKAADVDADPREREWMRDKEFTVLRVERGDDGEVWATIIGIERV
jgi:hypothetical protein